LKSFIDHILLLFPFEKKYFDKENINSTFIGHPFLEVQERSKTDISQITKDKKKLFSIYPGSRLSEITVLAPILFEFIKLMNEQSDDILFAFHSTFEYRQLINDLIVKAGFKNCEVFSDEKIKSHVLKQSMFALSKSGTISLEICNAKIPSVIIYKMNSINFFIVRMLVKVKFANIINIAAGDEIIPELLQSKCNPKNIFKTVDKLLSDKQALEKQVSKSQVIINGFRTDKSAEIASSVLIKHL